MANHHFLLSVNLRPLNMLIHTEIRRPNYFFMKKHFFLYFTHEQFFSMYFILERFQFLFNLNMDALMRIYGKNALQWCA